MGYHRYKHKPGGYWRGRSRSGGYYTSPSSAGCLPLFGLLLGLPIILLAGVTALAFLLWPLLIVLLVVLAIKGYKQYKKRESKLGGVASPAVRPVEGISYACSRQKHAMCIQQYGGPQPLICRCSCHSGSEAGVPPVT